MWILAVFLSTSLLYSNEKLRSTQPMVKYRKARITKEVAMEPMNLAAAKWAG